MSRRHHHELNCPRCKNRVSAVLADGEAKEATCIWCGAWLHTMWTWRPYREPAVRWKQVEVERD